MQIQRAYYTDIGRKQTNQDSLLYLKAQMAGRQVCLAVVCDGMGGLSKGELASAQVIRSLEQWFSATLPYIIGRDNFGGLLSSSWNALISRQNDLLIGYGKSQGVSVGTTIAAILLIDTDYYIANVGDSRVYMVTDQGIWILTKDQTLVMREVERGNLRYEDIENDPRRNILLQCVGAGDAVYPDYYNGMITEPTVFVVCSDGFRHLINPDEMQTRLMPSRQTDQSVLEAGITSIGKDVFARGEHDNVTAVAVSVR